MVTHSSRPVMPLSAVKKVPNEVGVNSRGEGDWLSTVRRSIKCVVVMLVRGVVTTVVAQRRERVLLWPGLPWRAVSWVRRWNRRPHG